MIRVAKGDIGVVAATAGFAIFELVRLSKPYRISRPVSATRLGVNRNAVEDGSASWQSDIRSIYETFWFPLPRYLVRVGREGFCFSLLSF